MGFFSRTFGRKKTSQFKEFLNAFENIYRNSRLLESLKNLQALKDNDPQIQQAPAPRDSSKQEQRMQKERGEEAADFITTFASLYVANNMIDLLVMTKDKMPASPEEKNDFDEMLKQKTGLVSENTLKFFHNFFKLDKNYHKKIFSAVKTCHTIEDLKKQMGALNKTLENLRSEIIEPPDTAYISTMVKSFHEINYSFKNSFSEPTFPYVMENWMKKYIETEEKQSEKDVETKLTEKFHELAEKYSDSALEKKLGPVMTEHDAKTLNAAIKVITQSCHAYRDEHFNTLDNFKFKLPIDVTAEQISAMTAICKIMGFDYEDVRLDADSADAKRRKSTEQSLPESDGALKSEYLENKPDDGTGSRTSRP